tara:strand:- start:825 stop:1451 length:627 start_codon:yes stop_codon:yes gene_type:complete
MKKNLFPLFLDGATQALSAAETATWNGKTSFVSLDNNGIGTFTLGEVADGDYPIEPGTVVSVYRSDNGSTAIGVLPKTGASALVSLDGPTESAVFMWDASEWKIVSNATANGSVTTTNFAATGNVALGDAVTDTLGFYGVATPVAQQSGAAQAAVTAETNLPTTGTGAGSSYTQDEVTAAIENIHDLIALTNEIRQCLVDLGLIKGAA